MHDVFVAVLRSARQLHDDEPAGLLLRVATNICLNRLRADRRRPAAGGGDDDLVLQIAAIADDGEARAAARHLLGRLFGTDDPLAASTATLAIMHLCDGLTLEETARESRLSVSGVRKRLARLRGRLAALEGTAERGAHP